MAKRTSSVGQLYATKSEDDELYNIMIGESANYFHFSLYNYPRKTMPLVDLREQAGELLVYEDTYSSGISAVGTLQYVLTVAVLGGKVTPSVALP